MSEQAIREEQKADGQWENQYDCWSTIPLGSAKATLKKGESVELGKLGLNAIEIPISDAGYDFRYIVSLAMMLEKHIALEPKLKNELIHDALRTIISNLYHAFLDLSSDADLEILVNGDPKLREKVAYKKKVALQNQEEIDTRSVVDELASDLHRMVTPSQQVYANESFSFLQKLTGIDSTQSVSATLVEAFRLLDDIQKNEKDSARREKAKHWYEEITGKSSVFRVESNLVPHPAMYHDDWTHEGIVRGDSMMRNNIPMMKAEYYVGTLQPGWGDLDQDATEKMIENIGYHVGYKTSEVIAPPNVTNLLVASIPIPPAITDRLANDFQEHRLVVCETPTRLNPNNITKLLDKLYGKGYWTLVTHQDGQIAALELKDKKDWKVTSERKPIVQLEIPDQLQKSFHN